MNRAYHSLQLCILVTSLLLMAATAQASEAKVEGDPSQPKDWWYEHIVDAEFVLKHAKMPKAEDVMIIDSRPYEAKYVKGYIPTAVSMPFTKFDTQKDQLPENKDALLIFYCGGFS